MLPFAVVEHFDVFEARRLHVGMGGVANAMHALVLETVEPALGRCVDAPMSSGVGRIG